MGSLITALHKFARLTVAEQRLLVKATFLLAVIRLGLWLIPYQTLRRRLEALKRVRGRPTRAACPSVDEIARAVTVGSRWVPRATCLSQALAAQVLLVRNDHPAQLRVGFARAEEGELQGHAWLESGGAVVVGDRDLDRYVRLPGMESGS